MKTVKRAPIEPAEAFNRAIQKARRTGNKIVADGITFTPPKTDGGSWRLRFTFNNITKERKSKDSPAEINAAFISIYSELRSLQLGVSGLPEFSHESLAETISRYISQGGRSSSWKGKSTKNRSQDFQVLKEMALKEKLYCKDFNASLMRRYLAKAVHTAGRAKTLIGVVKTFIKWGIGAGYFTHEQFQSIEGIAWIPPKDSNYKIAPTRREQSRIHFGSEDRAGGMVPTHEQVKDLATELQKYYKFGEGLIHVSANLGTRGHETLIFTADREIFVNGLGNFVDLTDEVVRVHWQYSTSPDKSQRVTKNNKFRSVVIPPVANVSTGFDVYEWLKVRSAEALLEQSAGKNPFALIFPNASGQVLTLNHLNAKMMRKALEALGWKMPAYLDAQGKPRHLFRFTLHSLRDRFGTTAADEWGYSERQLLEQGSWTDPETVRKFYLGTTDLTHESVKALHKDKNKEASPTSKLQLIKYSSRNF